MLNDNITIRLEKEADYRNTENLTREAFWNVYRPGCTEHYVLHCYRDDPAFVPELDFVMELNGELIGQVIYVRSEIEFDDGRSVPIMTFGPISGRAMAKDCLITLWSRQRKWVRERLRLPATFCFTASQALLRQKEREFAMPTIRMRTISLLKSLRPDF